jgi:hypothetical protein
LLYNYKGCVIKQFRSITTKSSPHPLITDTMNFSLFFEILSWIIFALLYDSLIEYAVHRFPMHKKILGLKFFFRHHMTEHHARDYPPRSPYKNTEHVHEIPFPIWVGPLLIIGAGAPFTAFGFFYHYWVPSIVVTVVSFLYYLTFEFIHRQMHVPTSPVVNTRYFKFVDKLHEHHHKNLVVNYNLVLHFGDLVFRTLKIPR